MFLIFKNFNNKIENKEELYLYNSARDRQWKTNTKKLIYGMNDRYRGIKNERNIILINPIDIENLNFKNGDFVNIKSHYNDNIKREVKNFKLISYNL